MSWRLGCSGNVDSSAFTVCRSKQEKCRKFSLFLVFACLQLTRSCALDSGSIRRRYCRHIFPVIGGHLWLLMLLLNCGGGGSVCDHGCPPTFLSLSLFRSLPVALKHVHHRAIVPQPPPGSCCHCHRCGELKASAVVQFLNWPNYRLPTYRPLPCVCVSKSRTMALSRRALNSR